MNNSLETVSFIPECLVYYDGRWFVAGKQTTDPALVLAAIWGSLKIAKC